MKEHFIYLILKHLYDRDAINDDFIDITDFLKTLWNKTDPAEEFNNLNRIRNALGRINDDHYGSYKYSPEYYSLNETKTLGDGNKIRITLENVAIQFKITTKGYDYIVEEIRKRKQDELNTNIIATNISLQAANSSAEILNGETKKYYSRLETATWVIAGATILNIAATLFPHCTVRNIKPDRSQTLQTPSLLPKPEIKKILKDSLIFSPRK